MPPPRQGTPRVWTEGRQGGNKGPGSIFLGTDPSHLLPAGERLEIMDPVHYFRNGPGFIPEIMNPGSIIPPPQMTPKAVPPRFQLGPLFK